MLWIKWDQAPAKSRASENRASTAYVRGTIYRTAEGFENNLNKRAIVWCEGDIDPDDYCNKLQCIIADIRDNVRVIGSTNATLVLSNIMVEAEITGDEAKEDRKAIMAAQNQHMISRGPRDVVRSAATGNVGAAQTAAAILQEAVGGQHAAREAAHALLGSELGDDAAMALAGALTGAPRGTGELHAAGNTIVGGVEHHGVTVYPEREGVELEPFDLDPPLGMVGGAHAAHAPGDELSPKQAF